MKKKIFVIIGSAGKHSANEKLMDLFADWTKEDFSVTMFRDLKSLPHFDPELSSNQPPREIAEFRAEIEKADGIIVCTPEYVFSIPAGLKNAIEWCVATTVFSGKPVGLITASAQGQKGHEELQLIMKTLMATFNSGTTLLIQGIKGKMNDAGQLTDNNTKTGLLKFTEAFKQILN